MGKKNLSAGLWLSASALALFALVCGMPATAGSGAADQSKPVKAESQSSATSHGVHIPITSSTLPNGLRVVLSEDHSAPTYSIAVVYDVGSRNEREGRTGFAHLFEHMMFQGSENVGKGEHDFLVFSNGGSANGTTDEDRTLYYETLPANQLELGVFLEADRMKSLAVTQANLDNQRNAVQEERRLRVDNQPYGKTFESISEIAYDNPAYKHSVIGSMADLNAASIDDVSSFFKMYYAPNNAVVAIVGDFKSADALAVIQKYFGDIKRQPAPPKVDMTEPAQTAERRKSLDDGFAQLSRIDIVYKIPPSNTPDWYALDVLGDVLGAGQSSRLYQELVKDKELAVGLGVGPQQARGPALFSVAANVRPGKSADELEKAIEADLDRVKTSGITADELSKVMMQERVSHVRQLQGTLGRAAQLAEDTTFYGTPELINTQMDNYHKVTAADVQRVAQKYLTQNNRSVIVTVPKPAAAPARSGQ